MRIHNREGIQTRLGFHPGFGTIKNAPCVGPSLACRAELRWPNHLSVAGLAPTTFNESYPAGSNTLHSNLRGTGS